MALPLHVHDCVHYVLEHPWPSNVTCMRNPLQNAIRAVIIPSTALRQWLPYEGLQLEAVSVRL